MQKSDLLIDLLLTIFFGLLISALIMTEIRMENHREKVKISDNRTIQALFPKGKAIGQPFSRFNRDLRMLRMETYGEALEFFLALCDTNLLRIVNQTPYVYYMYPLPDLGGGTLLFTNETDSKTNEMAVMYIRCDSINLRGVSELHFVKTTARKGLSQ